MLTCHSCGPVPIHPLDFPLASLWSYLLLELKYDRGVIRIVRTYNYFVDHYYLTINSQTTGVDRMLDHDSGQAK
jgi:hypothetical protein